MSAAKRRKRAAPDQLYRHCVQGGDCIPDVQNKYEQKTWADTLLKIFGSLLYFGNLGIGTGRGSGGTLGYRPLGTPSAPRATEVTPLRPNLTIDPIGPTDITVVDAAAPSIVPLSEGVPDISYIAPDAGPGAGAEDIELFTITNPSTDVGGAAVTPTVISTEEGAVAILDTQTIPERPVQVFYDPAATTTHEINVFAAPIETSSNVNVFVDSNVSGTIVGGEDIPLERLNYSEFEIEETPLTSTPIRRLESAINRTKGFYRRFIKQVPVRSFEFVTQPSRLVEFQFENPAFDADVTLEFERDLADITAAPAEEFQDVIRLHRPLFSSVEGAVRVSRLGDTGTIRTRSGTIIGQQVHFYHDISDIVAEEIELETFSTEPGTSIVDDIMDSVIVDSINTADVAIAEEDLLDSYGENFAQTHLILGDVELAGEPEIFIIPIAAETASLNTFIPALVDASIIDASSTEYPIAPILPVPEPAPHTVSDINDDYYLYPSLYPKRKRRRLDFF